MQPKGDTWVKIPPRQPNHAGVCKRSKQTGLEPVLVGVQGFESSHQHQSRGGLECKWRNLGIGHSLTCAVRNSQGSSNPPLPNARIPSGEEVGSNPTAEVHGSSILPTGTNTPMTEW